MSDSLFGKQGQAKAPQTQATDTNPNEPTMDFWSDEAHRPDAPVLAATPAAPEAPVTPVVSTAPEAPKIPVATPSSEGNLPASDQLIKPFEATAIEAIPAAEAAPVPEPAPTTETVLAETPPTEADAPEEETVREIGNTRFRRLEEPVDLDSYRDWHRDIPQTLETEVAAVTERSEPAVLEAVPTMAEPVIEPTITPPLQPITSEPSIEPIATKEGPVTEVSSHPIIQGSAPIIEAPATPQEPAANSDNLWNEQPVAVETPAPVVEALTSEPSPAVETSAPEPTPAVEIAIAPEPVMEAPATQPAPIAETPIVEAPVIADPTLHSNIQGIFDDEDDDDLLAELDIDPIAEEPTITADVLDTLDQEVSSATGEAAGFTLPSLSPGELAGIKTPPPAGADDSLQTLLTEHQQWLDSNGAQGRRAVFREENNLAGMDLSHQRLSGASFRGLNLARCKFTQAQLSEADFGDCQLEGSDFTAATINSANFTQANVNYSAFSAAQAQNADFSAAQAEDCNFTQANLQETIFRDANLKDTNLQHSTANLANFRGAQMESTDLNHSNLTQAIFREANLTKANFDGAQIIQASFKDAVLSHVDLNSTDFSQAQDVSAEIQAQFMQVERTNLNSEIQKLDRIRDELEQRERALIAEREQLQRQLQHEKNQESTATQNMPDVGAVSETLQKGSRLFLFFGIGWFLLSFLLAIILQNVISQLEDNELSLMEMMLMGVLTLVPLLFFVVSMSKSFSLSYALRKLTPHDPNEPI
ncbi:MAG: pentapeptide repeat-containing protein [Rickettsiales bacterium]|nr:pentapeptide repeat-containing protein [Rickettsiales bacterium]